MIIQTIKEITCIKLKIFGSNLFDCKNIFIEHTSQKKTLFFYFFQEKDIMYEITIELKH